MSLSLLPSTKPNIAERKKKRNIIRHLKTETERERERKDGHIVESKFAPFFGFMNARIKGRIAN